MATKTCSVDGCGRPTHARQMCTLHYKRLRKGKALDAPARIVGDDEARFWQYVRKTETCWLWTGATNRGGYGEFRMRDRPVLSHRLACQWLVGVIPIGTELDHLCRTTGCVNPTHLEAVAHSENLRRGRSVEATTAYHRARTHCARGHAFDEENTYYMPTGRACRACRRITQARSRAARRGADQEARAS